MSSLSEPEPPEEPARQESEFHRVLVAVEALPYSGNALALAARMGRATGGSVRLVHLRTAGRRPTVDNRRWPVPPEEAARIVDTAVSFMRARGVPASAAILEVPGSDAAAAIVAEAAEWRADVIVLTARPRRLVTAGPWDRVTRRVVRTAACPVLVVHPKRL